MLTMKNLDLNFGLVGQVSLYQILLPASCSVPVMGAHRLALYAVPRLRANLACSGKKAVQLETLADLGLLNRTDRLRLRPERATRLSNRGMGIDVIPIHRRGSFGGCCDE